MGTFAFRTGKAGWQTTYKTDEAVISVPIRLTSPATGTVSVDLTITGALSDKEDYGFGRDFVISGASSTTLSAYGETTASVSFATGNVLKTVTLTVENNTVIEEDRTIKLELSNPSTGHRLFSANTMSIKLYDDNRDAICGIVNVTSVEEDYPSWGLSNVVPGETNSTTKMQAIIDKVYDETTDGDTDYGSIIYMPEGTYNLSWLGVNPYVTFLGDGPTETVIRAIPKRAIGNPASISKHATDPIVNMPSHGLTGTTLLVSFENVVQSGWSSVLNNTGRDGNLFVCNYVSAATFSMRYATSGSRPTGGVLNSSGFANAYSTASNPDAVMYECYKPNRVFDTYKVGYRYSGAADAHPIGFKDIKYDGNSADQGPYQDHQLEQQAFIFAAATTSTAGKSLVRVQNVEMVDGVADGISLYTNVDAKLYNITADNVFRGAITITGGNTKVNSKDITVSSAREGGGVQIEVDGKGYGGTYTTNTTWRDITLNDGMWDMALNHSSGGTSYLTAYNTNCYCPTTNNQARNAYVYHNLGGPTATSVVTLNNSYFEIPGYNLGANSNSIRGGGTFTANNTIFALTGTGGTTPATAGTKIQLLKLLWDSKNGCYYNFNNCQFKLDTDNPVSDDFHKLAFTNTAIDADGTSYAKLDTCTFGTGSEKLDSLIYCVNAGVTAYNGQKINLEDTNVEAACRIVNYVQTYAISAGGYDSTYNLDITLNNSLINATHPMYIYGYSSAVNCYYNYIRINSHTLASANNMLATFNGLQRNNYININAKHPSSMVKGATTNVVCTSHGLSNDDKIMFDAILPTNEWFTGLCPQSAVPIFTVSGVSGATFTINYNSSGLVANYNGAAETLGVFWKHPGLRTITGITNDPTGTIVPAGFAGDRCIYNLTNYRCKTSGLNVTPKAVWELE
jgi:hypothetical protein